MVLKRTWQRGTADLISLGVGMMILGIVTAGTTAAMVYARELNLRNEHIKVAAYKLRAQMEETIGELCIGPGDGTPNHQSWNEVPQNLAARTLRVDSLDMPNDFGENRIVRVTISQEKIEPIYNQASPDTISFLVTMHAQWRERNMAATFRNPIGQDNELSFTTAVVVRSKI